MQIVLTTDLLLEAYRQGLFPMAQTAGSAYVHWICPQMRGQLSIEAMHIPRRLQRSVRQMRIGGDSYEIRIDTAFDEVIRACAQATAGRPDTWINAQIVEAYGGLHCDGYAHSVECWQDGELAGGLYGIALGRAFFGESMFSRRRDASKVALLHLVARLWKGGFVLLDTQFVNDHLRQFGVYELSYADYMEELGKALAGEGDFLLDGADESRMIADYFAMRANSER